MVRKAQEDVCESIPNCTLVNTDDLNGITNDLHYTQSGYQILGERFAQEEIKLIEGGENE